MTTPFQSLVASRQSLVLLDGLSTIDYPLLTKTPGGVF